MRITDLNVPMATPATTRPAARRTETGGSAPTVVASPKTSGAAHPDEVAAAALQRAAGAAQASRVVAAMVGPTATAMASAMPHIRKCWPSAVPNIPGLAASQARASQTTITPAPAARPARDR